MKRAKLLIVAIGIIIALLPFIFIQPAKAANETEVKQDMSSLHGSLTPQQIVQQTHQLAYADDDLAPELTLFSQAVSQKNINIPAEQFKQFVEYLQYVEHVADGMENRFPDVKETIQKFIQSPINASNPDEARASIQKLIATMRQSSSLDPKKRQQIKNYYTDHIQKPLLEKINSVKQTAPDVFQIYLPAADALSAMSVIPKPSGQGSPGPQFFNPFGFTDNAQANFDQGNMKDAASLASDALEENPANEQALLIRGESEASQNNFAAAARDAGLALAINPNDKRAQVLLGMTEGRGQVNIPAFGAAANQNQTAADSLSPGMGSPSSGRSAVLGSGSRQNQYASGQVTQAIGQSAQFSKQAQSDLSLGDYEDALAQTQKALAADPMNVNAYALRAMAYQRMKNYASALKNINSALDISPNDPSLEEIKASVLNRMGRYAEAKAAALLAIQGNPNNAAAYYDLANALAGLGDRNGMIAALKKAAAIDPRYEAYLRAAMQMPSDSDLTSLFDGNSDFQAPGSENNGSRNRLLRFGAIAGLSLIGGLLIALGLMRLFPKKTAEQSSSADQPITRSFQAASGNMPAGPMQILRGQYQLGRQIGAGGMGTVYEGLDISLGRRVAVKKMRDELKTDPKEKARFISEAKLVASLHHPNIVDIYAVVEDGQDAYLIFEHIAGKTAREILSEKGRFSLSETLSILRPMASALDYAHAHGIIHRDLKPSNVMVSADGLIKVMDFGIARAAKDAMTRVALTGTIIGTPPYMAPEQERGIVRKESDVYALGVCLYEMLSGRLPFDGTGSGILMNKINKEYPRPNQLIADLPKELNAVFDRVFEPDPDKRFATPRAFMAALDMLLAKMNDPQTDRAPLPF
ncbi:MAG: protein kinase domain-containing protein [Elusimicrobiota bacterium]